ncbi:hypothetical protein ACHAWF_018066 [Thalassiosira exigua]
MGVMNDFVIHMMDAIAGQSKAIELADGKCKTLMPLHVQTATRLTLPGELRKHGVSEGTKALTLFNSALDKKKEKN